MGHSIQETDRYETQPFSFKNFWFYCLLPYTKRKSNKLDPKAVRAILVGYDSQSKAYHCYCPLHRKTLLSWNILFNEVEIGQFPIALVDPLELSLFDPLASLLAPNFILKLSSLSDSTSHNLAGPQPLSQPQAYDLPAYPD
jgi:hypothetical protein